MELYNRRFLLLDEDVPISTPMPPLPQIQVSTISSSPPQTSPSTTFERPLQLSTRPFFSSKVAYAFLIFFTAIFFIGFVFLYIRRFSTEDSSRRRRRAPPCQSVDLAAAKSLPVVPYSGDAKQLECAICLEEFGDGDSVKMIPYCKHVFHPQCLDTWLSSHVTCPVCRCSKLCGSRGENRGEVGSV
ncbi:hypothetical protein VNO77_36597 [Canavalia gladiata]|uniref:RING-type E3 ubiquitin transferase n=1 Tax=Canavalia gladiata TaxID=3824 RepID=A0AAN9KA93_CANGL